MARDVSHDALKTFDFPSASFAVIAEEAFLCLREKAGEVGTQEPRTSTQTRSPSELRQ